MHEPVYDDERARRLAELLRTLAARIRACESDRALLAAGPELMRLMGDARSELFHYEVRCTYDTPEVAESRRIVEEAERQSGEWGVGGTGSSNDQEDEEPWRGP
jgi:hypothetical protein